MKALVERFVVQIHLFEDFGSISDFYAVEFVYGRKRECKCLEL